MAASAPPPPSNKAEEPEQSPIDITLQAHRLVARFLSDAGYKDTLQAFTREAEEVLQRPNQLSLTSTHSSTEPDLRAVVEDFISSRMSRLALEPAPLEAELDALEWKGPTPSKVVTAIRDGTNVLSVKSGHLPKRTWDSTALRFKSEFIPALFTTAVDRTLKAYALCDHELLHTTQLPSPVLCFVASPLHSRFVVCATMEGSLWLIDLVTGETLQKIRDHNKYIVKAAWSPDGRWIATLGYDKQIIVYEALESAPSDANAPTLLDDEEPDELATSPSLTLIQRHVVRTRTNPESAVFLPNSQYLVYSARDDHILHEVRLPGKTAGESDWALSGHNLNENGDTWVSFSILHISVHPHLPILALQTSTENSRILLYPFHSSVRLSTLHTTAAQSDYSTPRHSWLPNGSGLLCNSEDGVLRVVDLHDVIRAKIGAHGVAAPLEEDGEGLSDEVRTERARLRREQDRGSSVVKDVLCLERDDGQLVFYSGGFDKTVRSVHVV